MSPQEQHGSQLKDIFDNRLGCLEAFPDGKTVGRYDQVFTLARRLSYPW